MTTAQVLYTTEKVKIRVFIKAFSNRRTGFLATDPNFSFGEAYQGVPLTCLTPTTLLLMCALPL